MLIRKTFRMPQETINKLVQIQKKSGNASISAVLREIVDNYSLPSASVSLKGRNRQK